MGGLTCQQLAGRHYTKFIQTLYVTHRPSLLTVSITLIHPCIGKKKNKTILSQPIFSFLVIYYAYTPKGTCHFPGLHFTLSEKPWCHLLCNNIYGWWTQIDSKRCIPARRVARIQFFMERLKCLDAAEIITVSSLLPALLSTLTLLFMQGVKRWLTFTADNKHFFFPLCPPSQDCTSLLYLHTFFF